MKTFITSLILFISIIGSGQNNGLHLTFSSGKTSLGEPKRTPSDNIEFSIRENFGLGLISINQLSKKYGLHLKWGMIPTQYKIENQYNRNITTIRADGNSGDFFNQIHNKFTYIDVVIPIKILIQYRKFNFGAGINTLYHLNGKFIAKDISTKIEDPENIIDSSKEIKLCPRLLRDCAFGDGIWKRSADFWYTFEVGYQLKKVNISLTYDMYITETKFIQNFSFFGTDSREISSAISPTDTFGPIQSNGSVQISYRLF